jgi:UDP-hydrolysing UDP-N-acetyl-D-glucosamine 2-epimerase
MRTVAFVIVNRANYGRIRSLLLKLKRDKFFKIKIILASSTLLSKFGKIDQIIENDGLKVDYKVYNHISGENNQTMAKSVGLLTIEISSILSRLKPDIVFNVADRYEILATAIAASYLNIFLVHLQGGERTGSIDESVRHSVTKLSNLHLPATNLSKKRIIKMGENPKYVFNVGCPSIDEIKKVNFQKKVNLKKYNFGVGPVVDIKKPYVVVLVHPVTTNLKESPKIVKFLLNCIKKINCQCIWIWPNIDAGSDKISNIIRSFREKDKNRTKINFYMNFETEDYLNLIKNSKCLIGNSSSGIREASYLKVPAVNIGSRQIMRDRGDNVIDSNVKIDEIYYSIKKQMKKKINRNCYLYGKGDSADKIIKILKSIKLNTHKYFID